MIIYHYADNGEYLESSEARPSPMEPGIYLIPRNATTAPVLAAKDGYARLFVEGAWTYVIDKRGKEYWTSNTAKWVITEVGQDIPEGAFIEQPPAPEPPPDPAAGGDATSVDPVQPMTVRLKITRWQGKKWLLRNGPDPATSYLSIITAARASMTGNQAIEMDIDLNDAEYWYIDNPSVLTMKTVLGWSDEQLTRSFNEASLIEQ